MVLRDSVTEFGGSADCTQCKRLFEPQDWLQITCKICKEDLKSHGDIYVHHTIHSEQQHEKDGESELTIPKKEPIFMDSEPKQPSAKCGICNLPFFDLEALNMHVKMHHGKRNSPSSDLNQLMFNEELDLNIKTEDYFDDSIESEWPVIEDPRDKGLIRKVVAENVLKPTAKNKGETAVEEKYPVFIKCFHCDALCPTVDKLAEHNIAKHSDSSVALVESTKTKVQELDDSEDDEVDDDTDQHPEKTNEINGILENMSVRWRDEVKKIRYRISENPEDTRCKICGKQFWSKNYLLEIHMPDAHDTDISARKQCDECGKTFALKNYYQHKHRVHKNAEIQCDECGITFKKQQTYRTHMAIHRENPLHCDLCFDFISWGRRDIQVHKKKAHAMAYNKLSKKFDLYCPELEPKNVTKVGQDQYQCDYCRMIWPDKYKVQTHVIVVHQTENKNLSKCEKTPDGRWQCRFCGDLSTDKYKVQTHIYFAHNDLFKLAKPKRFRYYSQSIKVSDSPIAIVTEGNTKPRSSGINLDMIVYEGGFYYCGYENCGSKTRNKSVMRRHVWVTHEWKQYPEKACACPYCDYRCGSNQYMKNHIKHVHQGIKRKKSEKKLGCQHCSFKAAYPYEINAHVKTAHKGLSEPQN